VFNPKKHKKLRIVFDCAAKIGGMSLNDCIFSGPDLTNDISGVLMRFRMHKIALSADIEEMFLQVCLPNEDRGPFSFLWYNQGNLQQPPDTYQLNVHPFGATSSPFCASFALRRTADDFCTMFDEKTISTIKENFYVDDCLVSVDTSEEASTLVNELTRLLECGGFRLHKWCSNSREVLDSIPVSERSSDLVDLSSSDLQKTLGLFWCIKSDCFRFVVNLPEHPSTKRGMLSCTASLYDPLGFVAPLLLLPKHLLQRLCERKYGWDEQVDTKIEARWNRWKKEIQTIE
jgi:hypothetical protein